MSTVIVWFGLGHPKKNHRTGTNYRIEQVTTSYAVFADLRKIEIKEFFRRKLNECFELLKKF